MSNETMLRFPTVEQRFPEKRSAPTRTRDFAEIAADYVTSLADEQSSRCSQCGVPYCQVHCPLHNHIPDWLKLVAEERLEDAYELSNATSSMPEICGRICPQDRLCEGNCVIETSGHGAVTIGAIEKYITDTAWERGWVRPLAPIADRSAQSVGIVGAGPAGLTAAEALRLKGYAVTIYDRHDRPGGLLTYGIPGFKLEKPVVMRRIDRLRAGGIAFVRDFEVGRDATLADLRERHDAVLLATGVYAARAMAAREADNIVPALTYLTASNRKGFDDQVPDFESGQLNAHARRVVVIGGGDTAMDCVRTAIRQGAASVTCLYRRDRANMPGSQREVTHAEEEGVHFEWLAAPEGFEVEEGRVTRVNASRMRLGSSDASGRRAPEAEPGSCFALDVDLVIMALGFDPEALPARFSAPDLATTRWGTLRTDHRTMATSLDGVFAAGDIVRGASLVVWAIRDGRDAAAAMHAYLMARATVRAEAA